MGSMGTKKTTLIQFLKIESSFGVSFFISFRKTSVFQRPRLNPVLFFTFLNTLLTRNKQVVPLRSTQTRKFVHLHQDKNHPMRRVLHNLEHDTLIPCHLQSCPRRFPATNGVHTYSTRLIDYSIG